MTEGNEDSTAGGTGRGAKGKRVWRAGAAVPAAAAGLLLLYATLSVTSVLRETLTFDEYGHLAYGFQVMNGRAQLPADRGNKSPLSALNALPFIAETRLPPEAVLERFDRGRLLAARLATLPFGLLLGLFVFAWSKELYGPRGALLSLGLAALCPNLIAVSPLATTDLYGAFASTVALYGFFRLLEEGGWTRAAFAGGALGLALAAKVNGILLLPILSLLLAARAAAPPRGGSDPGPPDSPRPGALRLALLAAAFSAAALLVLNAAFLFNGTGKTFRGGMWASETFRGLAGDRFPAAALPLPLPRPFLEGLDRAVAVNRSGGTFGNVYLLGERRENGGFWNYYLVAFLYKAPLPFQALLCAAALGWLFRRGPQKLRAREASLILPASFYLVYLSLFLNVQVGIRYLLPAFPLFFVFCGRLLREEERHRKWTPNDETRSPNDERIPKTERAERQILPFLPFRVSSFLRHSDFAIRRFGAAAPRAAAATLLFLQAASLLSYHPHYIPYFNELLLDRRMAYRILSDSNLDWNQARFALQEYRARHPEAILHPPRPVPGRIVVSVNSLTGVLVPGMYEWLLWNFEPVDHIAHAYLVFDVDPKKLEAVARRGGMK